MLWASEGKGHHVLMSSSTSGTVTSIFGKACHDLPTFDHFLSPDEITLLKSHQQNPPNLDLVQDEEWSFLHAISILKDTTTSLEVIPSWFTSKLDSQFNNHVLHMVVVREESQTDILCKFGGWWQILCETAQQQHVCHMWIHDRFHTAGAPKNQSDTFGLCDWIRELQLYYKRSPRIYIGVCHYLPLAKQDPPRQVWSH
jgi:hypothetical protein